MLFLEKSNKNLKIIINNQNSSSASTNVQIQRIMVCQRCGTTFSSASQSSIWNVWIINRVKLAHCAVKDDHVLLDEDISHTHEWTNYTLYDPQNMTHIWQQRNVAPQLINLWLTAIFNVFDRVVANRQTLAACGSNSLNSRTLAVKLQA